MRSIQRLRAVLETRPAPFQREFRARRDAAEAENITLQMFQAMRTKIPTIDRGRHSHRFYHSRGFSLEMFLRESAAPRLEGETRAENLLEKSLERARHGA